MRNEKVIRRGGGSPQARRRRMKRVNEPEVMLCEWCDTEIHRNQAVAVDNYGDIYHRECGKEIERDNLETNMKYEMYD